MMQSDAFPHFDVGFFARAAASFRRIVTLVRDRRRRAASEKALLELDDHQLQDAGIDPTRVRGRRTPAYALARLATLNSLR